MIPRINVGKGVSGAVRYALSEGKDRNGTYRTEPKGEASRVAWISGVNFGFAIETAADADLARRIMEFDAANQNSRTKPCEKDCVHLSLGWRKGEQPTREQMEAAAQQALAALGMGNAKAIIIAHGDEPYAHCHVVASKIDPATGRAYDLKGDRILLSRWAQGYEQEHSGGIVCIRRAEANQLRDAIDRRDAAAVLALLTQQRATFKATDLERALSKQIKQPLERARFGDAILALPGVVRLAEQAGGPVTRYTTRAILQAEGQVLLSANALNEARRFRVSWQIALDIERGPDFRSMSREQKHALARAIGGEGLALIDGQAGTGKTYTMAAIRQAYEAEGFAVVGLAPTNVVAQDMGASGFGRACTIHAELFRQNNALSPAWTARTVVMVDEAAMIDTQIMAQLMRRAEATGAKVILIGDDRQLSSIDRGGMFGALKDRYGAAGLTEVRRQHKADERRASEMMAEGNFSAALAIYQGKGAIHWQHNQDAAREALVEGWARDSAADPSRERFVFAYTNDDVDQLNAAIRQVRRERGELGEDRRFVTKHGPADFAARDRIQITGNDKPRGLINSNVGTIERIDGSRIMVRLDGLNSRAVTIDAATFKDFRHGYAGTIYKAQGRTLDETYLYHSEHWKASSGYVGLTRHRSKMEIFVARDVVEDVAQLARQMARVDDRRAASRFHQVDGPLTIERIPTAALQGPGAGLAQPPQLVVNENRQAPEPKRGTRTMLDGPTDDELKQQPARVEQFLGYMQREHERAQAVLNERQNAQDRDDRAKDYLKKAELDAEEGKKRKAEQDAAEMREGRNGDIGSASARYSIALGQCYDVRDPYQSLARAAGAEGAAFHKSQEELRAEAARAKTPEDRQVIELRRRIESCEYMAITSDRLAGITQAVTGRLDSGQAIIDRQQAADWRARAAGLREERTALLEAQRAKEAPVKDRQSTATIDHAATLDNRKADAPDRVQMPPKTPEPVPQAAQVPAAPRVEDQSQPVGPTPGPTNNATTRDAQAATAAPNPASPAPEPHRESRPQPVGPTPGPANDATLRDAQAATAAPKAASPASEPHLEARPGPVAPTPRPTNDATTRDAQAATSAPKAASPAPEPHLEARPGPVSPTPGPTNDATTRDAQPGPAPQPETPRPNAGLTSKPFDAVALRSYTVTMTKSARPESAASISPTAPFGPAPAPAPAPARPAPTADRQPAATTTRRVVEGTPADRAEAQRSGVEIRRVSTPTPAPEKTNSNGVTRIIEVTDGRAIATGAQTGAVRRTTGIDQGKENEPKNNRGGHSR